MDMVNMIFTLWIKRQPNIRLYLVAIYQWITYSLPIDNCQVKENISNEIMHEDFSFRGLDWTYDREVHAFM